MNIESLTDKREEYVKKLYPSLGYLAEDCVQEAYRKAVQYNNSFDFDKDLEGWFSCILYNCKMTFLREDGFVRNSEVEYDDNLLMDELKDSFSEVVAEFLETLPDSETKRMLKLRWVLGYTVDEIEDLMNVSARTISRWTSNHIDKFYKWYVVERS